MKLTPYGRETLEHAKALWMAVVPRIIGYGGGIALIVWANFG